MAKKTADIRERLKAVGAGVAPSMAPAPYEAPALVPPPEKPEVHTQLSELISDRKARLALARMVDEHGALGQQIKVLQDKRDKLGVDIKNACGTHSISEADSGDWHISYYAVDRKSIDAKALIGLGVQPATVLAATKVSTSYTLRVSQRKEDEDGQEG